MKNEWEAFEGMPYRSQRRLPRVTMSGNKVFVLNRVAVEAIGNPEAVQFFFDAKRNRIGLKATAIENRFAFQLKTRPNQSFRTVNAGAFCTNYGIRSKGTVQFNEITVDEDGILTLDLTTVTKVGRGCG